MVYDRDDAVNFAQPNTLIVCGQLLNPLFTTNDTHKPISTYNLLGVIL